MLEVEHDRRQWIARCGGRRGVASSALEAIRAAVGAAQASIGLATRPLEAWVAEHAAQLESEAG